jgi:hypothetical protein
MSEVIELSTTVAPEFVEFPKIARLDREIIITEKIDGTNAQLCIANDRLPITLKSGRKVPFLCGSRNRWVFPENDNHGFASWAYANATEILALIGPGRHFGEWWGKGIQRGYGLEYKKFSLFNTTRWANQPLPWGVGIVPVLLSCRFDIELVQLALENLRKLGSVAAPGFMKPEGVVVFHTASNSSFKKTLEHDEIPKTKLGVV